MCAPQLVCRGATACCRQAPTDVLLSLLMPQTRAVEQLQAERDALAQSNWSQSVRHSQLELAKVGGMLAIAENAFQCRNVHATVCRRYACQREMETALKSKIEQLVRLRRGAVAVGGLYRASVLI